MEYKIVTPTQLDAMVEGKSQVKLIFFFTSWCSVCKKNYVELLRLEEKYKDDNFKVMAVSLDEDLGRLKYFMRGHNASDTTVYHLLYSDPNTVSNVFNKHGIRYTGAIPHITLLDEKGKIVADGNYDLSYFDKGLDKLLKRS